MRRLCVLVGLAAGVTAIVAVSASASPASRAPRIKGFTASQSTNWSGYAATGAAPFTDVTGSWVEPAVTCGATSASPGAKLVHAKGNGHGGGPGGGGGKPSKSQSSYASFWVGLDGDLSNTVEQIGTDSDCAGSSQVYYAWYEFYPTAPVNLSSSSYPVAPGDTLTGEVEDAGGMVTARLTSSRGWTFISPPQPDSGYALSSAEWIAEAPSSGSVLPLADFGTVDFGNASATGAGASGSIGRFTNDAITMVTKFGQPKAIPSALGRGGSAFTVTWQHS